MAGNAPQNKELPLAGSILCCTSILSEQRAELAAIAGEMGAVHKFDLTSDVSHLIVGETNTPKYKYVAKERSDVIVLGPEWIYAVRESWMKGGDTDLRSLEDKYRLPTFAGLSICVTGFEDLTFREHLKQTITANGGDFRNNLTMSVTHLIARTGQGQKYQFALEWGIRAVSVKWFEDSLERGMILEEELYNPLKPSEEQGIGAWNRSLPDIAVKRMEAPKPVLQRPRKLRRTASAKLSGHTEGLWTDIVGRNLDTPDQSELDQENGPSDQPFDSEQMIQAPKSFASETTTTESRGYMTRDTTQNPSQAAGERDRPSGFFFGCRFFIHGFSAKHVSVLRGHLLPNGAEISPSLDELSPLSALGPIQDLYIAIPFDLPRSKLPSTDHLGFDPEIVTDMWIERCLHSRRIVPPEAHITSTPFPKFPIPAFKGLRVCSTGFANVDLLHLSKLVNLMGATYDEYLTPKASVLVCNTPNPSTEKLRHTGEWNIPAVLADWLWISVQTGEKKPFDPYIIPNGQSSRKSGPTHTTKQQPAPLKSRRSSHSAQVEKLTNVSHEPSTRRPSLHKGDSGETQSHDPTPSVESRAEPISAPQEIESDHLNEPLPTRSLSPSKDEDNTLTSAPPNPPREESNATATSGPLGVAISELLKHKRQSSKRSANSALEGSNRRTSKRRPLLGRANSLASTRAVTTVGTGAGHSNGISRAGSIDSLNDDGSGSVFGSVIDDTDNQSNLGKSNAQSFCSVLTTNSNRSENGLNVYHSRHHHHPTDSYYDDGTGLGDGESQPMTQLGYEDPDAAAMREKIMGRATTENNADGSTTTANTRGKKKNGGVVLGEVRDLESLSGWGGGRRTRRNRGTALEDER